MAYRFKRRGRLAGEVRRVAGRQLALALESLEAVGTHDQDEAVHAARRRLKKVRALVQLLKRPLGDFYAPAHRRLDRAVRLLAGIADAEELVNQCNRPWAARLTAETRAALTQQLRAREARIDRRANAVHVLPQVTALVRQVQADARAWTLEATGFGAIAPGLRRSVRRLRSSQELAQATPTAAHMRRWRRRVKDLWYQLRLLDRRCGGRLEGELRALETLDGLLGEYHNIRVLEQVLLSEPLLATEPGAAVLQQLRRRQHHLARRARALGEERPLGTPGAFTRRVRLAWMAERHRLRSQRWRRAA